METPICDFVRAYANSGTLRLHMPGHKGRNLTGMEKLDITEIDGADSLYEAEGIIARSEDNASHLFGCRTLYSTEGSSQCIRAMLYLALMYAKMQGRQPLIAAGRNAHKTFLSAAALLDLSVDWLCPAEEGSYLSCPIEADALEDYLRTAPIKPAAVYLTSPDYLGNCADIARLSEVCHRHGALLIVDNAHGAYLRFLPQSRHPMDLGADLCCDSAHKTLPVLTGGAYLHLSDALPLKLCAQARTALALFGSTSPSYLILQSLDAANGVLAGDYRQRLADYVQRVAALKARLARRGYVLCDDEPLKITIAAKPYGYTGTELAQRLRAQGMECEFADPDFLVLMVTPDTGDAALDRLGDVLDGIVPRTPLCERPPRFHVPEPVMSIRRAALSPCETLPAAQCEGRILSAASVGCPPAVPIAVCGERLDRSALDCFRYYGIDACTVVLREFE